MKTSSPLSPRRVLGVGAHPDDIDFVAAGTIAGWAAAGAEVYYLILTDGGKGSSISGVSPAELTKRRREEQRAAARELGVKDVIFLEYPDAGLEASPAVKRDIVRCIREHKPEVVIAWDPTWLYSAKAGLVNHTDHRACGEAVVDAVYPLARDLLTFPEHASVGLSPHKVKTLLLYHPETATYFEDISATLEQKIAAVKAHVSQMPPAMIQQLEDDAKAWGKQSGYQYAEGFIRLDLPA